MQPGPVAAVVYGGTAAVPPRGRSLARGTRGAKRGARFSTVANLRIEPITEAQYETLLPMIADYQEFYEEDEVRGDQNRAFFRRFIAPSDVGELLGAWYGEDLVGYACLYWHFSSTRAVETVLMNDLYVDPAHRRGGIGRALIEASARVAHERGAHHLEWATKPDNVTAQRLYDSTGAERSEWVEYELKVAR